MPRIRYFRKKIPFKLSKEFLQESTKTIAKKKQRWLTFVKLSLSASVTLMIAVFTIVSYIHQTEIAERNRIQDERLANATHDKDLEIANLTRIQDQIIANITRYHDLEIANLTQIKDWEIALANLVIANETKIQDRQIAEENRNEDRAQQQDLHYETVYATYIEDISTVLYKQPYNYSMFKDNEKKMLYIRRKTLLTLRSIDSERRSQLFVFLHENNLLPDQSSPNTTISLVGADLRHIVIKSPVTGQYQFNSLSLLSLNLMNATFIDCRFTGKINFTGSIVSNATFSDCTFENIVTMYETKLINASFIDCVFKKETQMKDSDLNYAQFIRSSFDKLSLIYVNITNGSFIGCTFNGKSQFYHSEMQNISFVGSIFKIDQKHHFDQVSLNYCDFRNVSMEHTKFENSSLIYANFSDAYLNNVEFSKNTFLTNSDFYNSKYDWTHFTETVLTDSRIDLTDSKLHFSNVILPNGTWLINYNNIMKNGDAETHCWPNHRENTISEWSKTNGAPITYYHKKASLHSENSVTGNCSFKCADADEQMCIMERNITLEEFIVFLDDNASNYSISAYFGSDSECAENSTDVLISGSQTTFKRQLQNPYIKSNNGTIQWKPAKLEFKLMSEKKGFFTLRVTFHKNSTSCLIDNIEFRLKQASNKKPS
ncbi:unnamed protein product [Adineta steineri]|uniref:Pentapeptide repeat-containing protein n=1 Tax=Adineta steineri TaxID=433720 RepID=A0A814XX25_9BILA|nr:unnamed protein product [Adineta steineri]CAF1221951.1 unnamed protein product [Adineta steineri]